MEKRKRSRKPTGRPRGRPKKTHAPADSPAPPAQPGDVESLIASASGPASSADAAASLDGLARDIEREKAERSSGAGDDAPPLTGDVYEADGRKVGEDPADTPWGKQKSSELAVYLVLIFGAFAVWLGDSWIVTEEEARTVSDATVRAYPTEIASVEREYKFAGPLAALLLLIFTKWVASKREPAAEVERLPGTAPADA